MDSGVVFEAAYDVVVIGGGGAGLASAVEASRAGARVVVLEKGLELKGTTGRAVGSITASGTRLQREAGVQDSPAEHLEDYLLMAGRSPDRPEDRALVELLIENAGETVDWLEDLGVVFFGPVVEPPHRKARMHNALPTAHTFIFHLSRAARRQGVDIRLGVRAHTLETRGARVSSVRATTAAGEECRFLARRGVVLAGGDFSGSEELRREFFQGRGARFPAVNPLATGDCQTMARALGAEICNGHLFEPQIRFPPPPRQSWLLRIPPHRLFAGAVRWALRHLPPALIRPFAMSFVTTYLAPDPRLFEEGAVLVDRAGRGVEPGDMQDIELAGGDLYAIFDAGLARKFSSYPHYVATAPNVAFAFIDDFRRNRKDVCVTEASLEALGARLGIPAASLRETMAAHDARPGGHAATEPPFTALGPIRPYILVTHGGLRVGPGLDVLGRDGLPIPGLYAAGATGRSTLLLPGHGHNLGWAFTSGRIAGRNAARPASQDAAASASAPAWH